MISETETKTIISLYDKKLVTHKKYKVGIKMEAALNARVKDSIVLNQKMGTQ